MIFPVVSYKEQPGPVSLGHAMKRVWEGWLGTKELVPGSKADGTLEAGWVLLLWFIPCPPANAVSCALSTS